MKFEIEIEDSLIEGVGNYFFNYPEAYQPEMEQRISDIQSKLEEVLIPALKSAIYDAPEVRAKQAELTSLVESKLAASRTK